MCKYLLFSYSHLKQYGSPKTINNETPITISRTTTALAPTIRGRFIYDVLLNTHRTCRFLLDAPTYIITGRGHRYLVNISLAIWGRRLASEF